MQVIAMMLQAALCLSGSSWSGGGATIPAELLEALDDADFRVRQTATETILRDSSITDTMLLTLLAEPERLSPEQYDRIEQIAGRRRLGQVAAIGITVDPVAIGLRVTDITAGAQSLEVLQVDDVILSIEGQNLVEQTQGVPTDMTEYLQMSVSRKSPGEEMEVDVMRDGRRLTLQVPLTDTRLFTENTGYARLREVRERQWAGECRNRRPRPRVLAVRVLGEPAGEPTPVELRARLERQLLDLYTEISVVREALKAQPDEQEQARLETRLEAIEREIAKLSEEIDAASRP